MIGSSQEVLQRLGFSDKLKESEFIRNFNHWHQTSSERSSLSYFNPEKLKHEAEAFLRGYGVEYWSPTLRTHLLPSAPVFWSNDITHAETQRRLYSPRINATSTMVNSAKRAAWRLEMILLDSQRVAAKNSSCQTLAINTVDWWPHTRRALSACPGDAKKVLNCRTSDKEPGEVSKEVWLVSDNDISLGTRTERGWLTCEAFDQFRCFWILHGHKLSPVIVYYFVGAAGKGLTRFYSWEGPGEFGPKVADRMQGCFKSESAARFENFPRPRLALRNDGTRPRHKRIQSSSTSSNESSDYKPEVTDNEDVNINSENDGEVAASRGDPVHSRLMQELVELPEISGPSGVKDLPSKVDSLEATTNKASKRVAEDTSYLYAASPAATGGATLSSVAVDAIDVWVMPPGSTKERYLLRDDVLKLGLRDLFDKIFSLLQRRDIARIDVRFLVDVKTWFILTSASVDDSEDFEKAKKSIKKVVGKQIKTGADEEDMEIEIKTSTS